jgi:hypothetical protein
MKSNLPTGQKINNEMLLIPCQQSSQNSHAH